MMTLYHLLYSIVLGSMIVPVITNFFSWFSYASYVIQAHRAYIDDALQDESEIMLTKINLNYPAAAA